MNPLREALKEIAKGEGAYSHDQLEHATNTIRNMKEIANEALSLPDSPDAEELLRELVKAAETERSTRHLMTDELSRLRAINDYEETKRKSTTYLEGK